MTFDPAAPWFTGKLRFQSTNPAGQRYYLSFSAAGSIVAPTVSATAADPTTVWLSYDAGSGAVVLVASNGMYLAIQPQLNTALLSSSVADAATIVVSVAGQQVSWGWKDPASGQVLQAYYELNQPAPATLTFLVPGQQGPGALGTFAETTVTPGLATILGSKSAAGMDLSAVNLTGADLSEVNCQGTNFSRAVLSRTTLTGAAMGGANFTGCTLTGVVWGANPAAAGANFTGSIGTGMVVTSTGATKRATFDAAQFLGADWSGCDLTNASLHGAFAAGANFSGANLSQAYLYAFQGGKSNDGTVPGVNLSFALLADANLQSANLNGADLSQAQVYILNTGAQLLGANLTEANLTGADLSGASFGGPTATVAGTNFDRAVLFDASFDGVSLTASANGIPVSMQGAFLENASFTNTSFSGVRMSGARVALANGVPLFSITSGVTAAITALDAGRLPAGFAGDGGSFAAHGVSLSPQATVAVITAGQAWTLTQNPVSAAIGVEDVGFSVVATAGALAVSTSTISLVEEAPGDTAYAVSYSVLPTTLPPTALSPDTICPNGRSLATNTATGLSWAQAVTARRPALAPLGDTAAPLAAANRRLPQPPHRSQPGPIEKEEPCKH
jgi:uncharacterized protein YjbI with pentapeptide repeats